MALKLFLVKVDFWNLCLNVGEISLKLDYSHFKQNNWLWINTWAQFKCKTDGAKHSLTAGSNKAFYGDALNGLQQQSYRTW